MRAAAIIVAGGSGVRFGQPKHAVLLDGIELWRHSVAVFEGAGIDAIVVVGDVPEGVPGGQRRRDSVANGLAAIPMGMEWILVHDAARPLVTVALIERVLARASNGDVDGVVPALLVTDTIKRIDGETVTSTVDRVDLVTVQTPQAFRVDSLIGAHRDDQGDATDDASLVERSGGTVVHVLGDPMNIKITVPDDIDLAESLLAARASRE